MQGQISDTLGFHNVEKGGNRDSRPSSYSSGFKRSQQNLTAWKHTIH